MLPGEMQGAAHWHASLQSSAVALMFPATSTSTRPVNFAVGTVQPPGLVRVRACAWLSSAAALTAHSSTLSRATASLLRPDTSHRLSGRMPWQTSGMVAIQQAKQAVDAAGGGPGADATPALHWDFCKLPH